MRTTSDPKWHLLVIAVVWNLHQAVETMSELCMTMQCELVQSNNLQGLSKDLCLSYFV